LIVFADIGDRLEAAPGAGLRLDVRGPFADALAETAGENLVLRAARALAVAAGVAADAHLILDKALPVAAGIGGGSADAAAALRALVRLWRIAIPPADLARLALDLGADVPACLASRPVSVAGIGERLSEPAGKWPPLHFVLVNPLMPLATAAVFAARDAPFAPPMPLRRVPASTESLVAAVARRRNDLEAPALRLLPAVADVLAEIAACEGCRLARMSGSGATCFGLLADPESAAAAATAIRGRRPAWWVAAGPMRRP